MSKGGRGKVDLPEIINWAISEIRRIDDDSEMEQKRKTRAHERLAKKIRTRLSDDKRIKEEDRLALSSMRRYLTTVRAAITEQNWRHHGLEANIERLAKRYPRYAERLRDLVGIHDITELRLAHRELVNEIRQDGDSVAFEEIAGLKLDHEIMRHLTLPTMYKATLATNAVEGLEKRATNTVDINYYGLMSTIQQLMASRQQLPDGRFAPVRSHMALALALATGRRAWEVLVLGRFKKVGEYEVEFSGQAKKRGGVDYGASYRIYTLLPADQVLEGFKALRALPDVVELQSLDNREFSLRTASSLNRAARSYIGEDRIFKDSRAIWARLVFELHFNRDQRWKSVNETVFWREQLGHEDMDTQESYKAFKITYTKPEGLAEKPTHASRLDALKALDENEHIQKRDAMRKIHEWVKAQIAEFPEAPITQSLITRDVGSGRQVIKDYLAIAEEALSTPSVSLSDIIADVPADVAKAKPKLAVHKLADGQFEATAHVNGVEVARVVAADRNAALHSAFETARS